MGPEQDDLLLLPKQDELLLLPEQDDLLLHPEQDELVERAADVAYIVGKLATLPAAVSHVLAWPRTDFGIGNPCSCQEQEQIRHTFCHRKTQVLAQVTVQHNSLRRSSKDH